MMNTPIEDLFALAEEAILPAIWTKKKALIKFKASATPERVREVAKAFRALEQENILLKQGCENNPLVHELIDWRERAEAAEAKLAELEKQEPAGYAVKRFDNGKFGSWLKSKGLAKGDADYYVVPLFERPAPAINLAELVPANAPIEVVENMDEVLDVHICDSDMQAVWSVCRAAILRNIEGAV